MRALIVSYYFPPAAGGGVQRVLSWARYLPEFGIDVDVLTPNDPKWLHAGGVEVPEGTMVHRTRSNPSPRSFSPADAVGRARGMHRLWRKVAVQPRRLLLPDTRVGWAPVAARLGERVVRTRGIDVIISTSPPETDHLVGRRLARRTGTPWVADFRDSWLDLPHLRLDQPSVRAKHAINRWLARRTIDHAQAITTVSGPLARDLRTRHPGVPVHVVTNGIDLDDLATVGDVSPDTSVCTIAYTGNFFGRQSPKVFLDGLAELLGRRPELLETLRVRFIGRMKQVHEDRILRDPTLSAVIAHEHFLPYAHVLRIQREADALFLHVASGVGSEGVFTGKVFEYVAARRPVIAQAPADNVAAKLVREAGLGVPVDPDSVEAASAAIEQVWQQWRDNGRTQDVEVPQHVLDSISRRELARQFADLLKSVALKNDGPAVKRGRR